MSLESQPDFIIIGGGTAGLVLATRLTEIASINVLVLEAGSDLASDARVNTPALFPTLLGSEADWNFQTRPQEAVNGRVLGISHGRALGGSSAINGTAFLAPSKADIDSWAALGNPGWDWETLHPYFLKSHTRSVPADVTDRDRLGLSWFDESLGGTEGPIKTSFPVDSTNALPKAWLDTLNNMGHKIRSDPYGAHNITGVFALPASVDDKTKERSYAANAYLKPATARNNLKVMTGALVQRLVLSRESNEAPAVVAGIEYVKDGVVQTAKASKEVFLCAGAIQSPKLLELSGVGKASRLTELRISTIIKNDFVGENLQDHPQTGLSFEVVEGVPTIDGLLRRDPEAMAAAMDAYTTTQSGPLANGGVHLHALLPLQGSTLDAQTMNALVCAGKSQDQHPLRKLQEKLITERLFDKLEGSGQFFTYPAQGSFGAGSGDDLINTSPLPGSYYSIAVALLHPLSRGYTHIMSRDAEIPPDLDPQYLSHPLDLEVFTQHMLYVAEIVKSEPLKSLLLPGGRRNELAPPSLTDADSMKEYIRKTMFSAWHPVGTCAMLPRESGGVVDTELRVYGAANLRVVDASIMPLVPRANTCASVYMIAERAADLIKQSHNLPL